MKLFDLGLVTFACFVFVTSFAAMNNEIHLIEKEQLTDEMRSDYEAQGCQIKKRIRYGGVVRVVCPRNKGI